MASEISPSLFEEKESASLVMKQAIREHTCAIITTINFKINTVFDIITSVFLFSVPISQESRTHSEFRGIFLFPTLLKPFLLTTWFKRAQI